MWLNIEKVLSRSEREKVRIFLAQTFWREHNDTPIFFSRVTLLHNRGEGRRRDELGIYIIQIGITALFEGSY